MADPKRVPQFVAVSFAALSLAVISIAISNAPDSRGLLDSKVDTNTELTAWERLSGQSVVNIESIEISQQELDSPNSSPIEFPGPDEPWVIVARIPSPIMFPDQCNEVLTSLQSSGIFWVSGGSLSHRLSVQKSQADQARKLILGAGHGARLVDE